MLLGEKLQKLLFFKILISGEEPLQGRGIAFTYLQAPLQSTNFFPCRDWGLIFIWHKCMCTPGFQILEIRATSVLWRQI